jgi:hypothetical protein
MEPNLSEVSDLVHRRRVLHAHDWELDARAKGPEAARENSKLNARSTIFRAWLRGLHPRTGVRDLTGTCVRRFNSAIRSDHILRVVFLDADCLSDLSAFPSLLRVLAFEAASVPVTDPGFISSLVQSIFPSNFATMDYDAYDAILHMVFKKTQEDAWFKPSEENVAAGVCLRVETGHFRVFPYEVSTVCRLSLTCRSSRVVHTEPLPRPLRGGRACLEPGHRRQGSQRRRSLGTRASVSVALENPFTFVLTVAQFGHGRACPARPGHPDPGPRLDA